MINIRCVVTVSSFILVLSCNNYNLVVNRFKNDSIAIKSFSSLVLDSSLCMSEFIYSIEKEENFISMEFINEKENDSISGYKSVSYKYNYITANLNLCDKKFEILNQFQKEYLRRTCLYLREIQFEYALINNDKIILCDKIGNKSMIYFPLNLNSYQHTKNYNYMETLDNNWYVIEYKYDLSL